MGSGTRKGLESSRSLRSTGDPFVDGVGRDRSGGTEKGYRAVPHWSLGRSTAVTGVTQVPVGPGR